MSQTSEKAVASDSEATQKLRLTKRLEALHSVIALLQPLDHTERARILHTAVQFFNV